jgi:hypothetical protein
MARTASGIASTAAATRARQLSIASSARIVADHTPVWPTMSGFA